MHPHTRTHAHTHRILSYNKKCTPRSQVLGVKFEYPSRSSQMDATICRILDVLSTWVSALSQEPLPLQPQLSQALCALSYGANFCPICASEGNFGLNCIFLPCSCICPGRITWMYETPLVSLSVILPFWSMLIEAINTSGQ